MRASNLSDLPENWKEILHELMSEGKPVATVLKAYGITRGAHRGLLKHEAEYAEEMEVGNIEYEDFWHEWVKSHAEGKGASVGMFFLKCSCGYRDYEVKKDDADEKGKGASEDTIAEQYKNKENEHTNEAH